MTNRPNLNQFRKVNPIKMQQYERYLPTAFDESLSILEKMNKVIQQMNEVGTTTNDVVEQWNSVMEWIMNEGLNSAILQRLTLWLDDGTLERIINDQLLHSKANTTDLDQLRTDFESLQTTMNTELTELETRLRTLENDDGLGEHNKYIDQPSNVMTVRVPTDFATLQDAMDDIGSHQLRPNLMINVEIEKGHRVASGIQLVGGNYGQVNITSEDNAVVVVANTFTGRFITTDLATAPTLACFVDGVNRVDRIYSVSSGEGKVLSGCGGRNTTGRILYAFNAHINAGGSIWENFADQIYTSSGGGINLGGAEIRGSTISSNGSVTVSRGASVEAQNIIIENCVMGVEVKRSSSFNAHDATFRNIQRRGIMSWRASQASVDNAVFQNCGEEPIYVIGGMLTATDATISTTNTVSGHPAVYVIGGEVTLTRAKISRYRDGIDARGTAQVNAAASTVTGNTRHGVVAQQLANVNMQDATSTGNGQNDLWVNNGGIINARGCTTSRGTPSTADTNLTGNFNNLDTYRGLIWG